MEVKKIEANADGGVTFSDPCLWGGMTSEARGAQRWGWMCLVVLAGPLFPRCPGGSWSSIGLPTPGFN